MEVAETKDLSNLDQVRYLIQNLKLEIQTYELYNKHTEGMESELIVQSYLADKVKILQALEEKEKYYESS